MSTLEHLRSWESFAHFNDEQLDRLSKCVSIARYPAESTIFEAAAQSTDAYLITEGQVRVQRQTPYGHYTLALLGEGRLFGEASFIDGQPRSGDAVFEAETELLTFNHVVLTTLMERDQQIAVAFYWTLWKSLALKLRATNDQLTRFFSEQGPRPSPEPAPRRRPKESSKNDLKAKRDLFREQKLSNMEINFLSSLSQQLQVGPGEMIFREGDPGDKLYVVLDGRVMISKDIPGAGEEALAFIERGDYFGEMALIDNQPRSADAKVPTDGSGAVLVAIPREVVEGLLDIQKVSSLRLLKLLCGLISKRLRELNEKLITWFIFSGGGTDAS
ncbi:MAG: cyclic nucleotide-binding domain-containing protein [Acidobacteriota bacterium]